MKRALCMLLGALLLMGLCQGCRREEVAPADVSSMAGPEKEAEPYKIGLVQCGSYAPLDVMRESFMSRLDEWGYDERKVELDYQNAGDDEKKAASICKKFTQDEADMIVAVGAPAAKAASEAVGSSGIKVLFAGVTDPAGELGIKNLNAPERGVTGVSDRMDGQKVVELAQQVKPGLKSVGLLYDPEDANASAAAKAVQDACRQAGLDTQTATALNAEGAAAAAQDLCAQADVLYTPGDGAVAEAAGKIAEIAAQEKKPWLAGADSLVQGGAFAAFSADYEQVGNQVADMAVQVIVGKQVSQLPVVFFDSWQIWVNQSAMEALELDLPEELLSTAHYPAAAA